jgi:hypothetical protein
MSDQQSPHEHELAMIRDNLWNYDVGPGPEEQAEDRLRGVVLEQYKLYVEMADRVSSRRGLTNTFFLTLNTLVFTAFGVLWKENPPDIAAGVLIMLLAVLLAQCAGWWFIVRSYGQLNSAKYKVVGLLEERLPAAPYSNAEWTALKRGRDWQVYTPLTHVEQWIPVLFAVVYALAFVLALDAS